MKPTIVFAPRFGALPSAVRSPGRFEGRAAALVAPDEWATTP
jgi:hypothetical protein